MCEPFEHRPCLLRNLVAGSDGELLPHTAQAVPQAHMAVHHAFWRAGRAGGVDAIGGMVGGRGPVQIAWVL